MWELYFELLPIWTLKCIKISIRGCISNMQLLSGRLCTKKDKIAIENVQRRADRGYPHNGHANNASYQHDSRADKWRNRPDCRADS